MEKDKKLIEVCHAIEELQHMPRHKTARIMPIDKNQFYQEMRGYVDELQRRILAYDKDLQKKEKEQNIYSKRNRTIAEEEDIIINKFGGKKLDLEYFYNHLSDFLFDGGEIDYLKLISQCKIIFNFTEEVIPEEYFYSLYLIPLKESEKYEKPYDKEVIVYISSRDGVNLYIASLLSNQTIRSEVYHRKLASEICYYKEGIAVYPNEMQ